MTRKQNRAEQNVFSGYLVAGSGHRFTLNHQI
jgi:hypothetical protein